MPLPKLLLPVEREGYTAKPGNTVIQVKLDGGKSRTRSDKLGACYSLTVQWTIGPENYKYLQAFYRTATNYGALPFLIDLVLEDSSVQEYTAQFIADSFMLRSQSGLTYVVAAQLEAIPQPPTTTADNATITAGPVL